MPVHVPRPDRKPGLVAAGIGVALLIGGGLTVSTVLFARAEPVRVAQAGAAAPTTRPVPAARPARAKPDPARPAETQGAPAAQGTVPAVPPAQPVQAGLPPATAPEVAGQLRQNGAGACATQIDALAAATMGDVAQFNTVSSWASTGGNARVASVSIAQKYPDGSAVPYGATSVIAAPNGQGSCDALAVQVVPSPLPCAKLRDSMAARGRQIGDLAGVPLMQDPAGQTMLVPTAANTCVLVGLRTAYGK